MEERKRFLETVPALEAPWAHAAALAWLMALACVMSSPAGAAAAGAGEGALYQSRFNDMMAGKSVYEPMEEVPGAQHIEALRAARAPTITAEALSRARSYAQANNSSALLIWRDGYLQFADYFNGVAETPLVAKSLAKPLTAIVIGRAMQLGYIRSLDQPVSDFIAQWKAGPKSAIKIRHLLDMRSGLLPQAVATRPEDILNRAYLDPHHDDILINDYPLVHPPGTRFDYANAVADLIAIVIEHATHQRYARFVSDAVLKPLGAAGGSVWVDRPGGLAHSGCCILLPAESWLRLSILLLNEGRWNGRQVLPPGFVETMKQPTLQNPYYGLGLYIAGPYVERRGFGNPDLPGPRVLQGEPYLAKDLFLFDGNADQVIYMIPSQRLIILRMGDAPPRSPEWDNAVLPNMILRGLIGPAPSVGPQPAEIH